MDTGPSDRLHCVSGPTRCVCTCPWRRSLFQELRASLGRPTRKQALFGAPVGKFLLRSARNRVSCQLHAQSSRSNASTNSATILAGWAGGTGPSITEERSMPALGSSVEGASPTLPAQCLLDSLHSPKTERLLRQTHFIAAPVAQSGAASTVECRTEGA